MVDAPVCTKVLLRMIDQNGNRHDLEGTSVPRIGERVMLEYAVGGEPLRDHYFRVKDVMHRLDQRLEVQVSILVEEERNPKQWPS